MILDAKVVYVVSLYEWYMARFIVEDGHQKDMGYNVEWCS